MIESSPPSRTGERRWRDDLHLAHTIADQVDPLTQAHFDNQDFEIETKPDLTPVTVADREAERLIRDYLSRARTRDSVLGEEFGTTGHSPRQWIIDPIDGTKNFVRGVPVWASLISLAEDGEVVVGLVSAPALGKRWWAVKQGCWRTRAYGDFWSYMLLASGAVDVAAEPELEVYDMAALVPIVSEAGGRFTSLAGEPGPWGGDAVATNGPLHDAVLTLLAKETD